MPRPSTSAAPTCKRSRPKGSSASAPRRLCSLICFIGSRGVSTAGRPFSSWMRAGLRLMIQLSARDCGNGSRRCARKMLPWYSPPNRWPISTPARSRPRLSRAARPGSSFRTSAPSNRRSSVSTGVSVSMIARSRSSPAQHLSATITASPAAAIACSSSDWGRSHSPSPPHLPRPIKQPLRRSWPSRPTTLCRRLAAPQGPRLGGGLARQRTREAAGHHHTSSGDHAMSLRSARQMASIAIACVAITTLAMPVRAQMIVYDPSNYAQNVLQAARALQQINNQITSLQNETQMLLNQAKNLMSLPYSSLQAIGHSFARTQQLLNEAQHLAYNVNQIDQAFQRLYPQGYTGATSSQQLVSDAKERWQNSLAAYQDALRVQVGAVGNLDNTRTETDTLVSSSQSAVGALQALQAGNQLVALQTRQLADLTAVVAAQSRAQSLAGARTTSNQEQAREQLSRFLGGRQSYQPQTVQMFH